MGFKSQAVIRENESRHNDALEVDSEVLYHAVYCCNHVGEGFESVEALLEAEDVIMVRDEEGGSIKVIARSECGYEELEGVYYVNGANELVKEANND
tara:strand:- start:309 stop:599 length:291 start_codon:yes stop_codon:yes gene_type:complete